MLSTKTVIQETRHPGPVETNPICPGGTPGKPHRAKQSQFRGKAPPGFWRWRQLRRGGSRQTKPISRGWVHRASGDGSNSAGPGRAKRTQFPGGRLCHPCTGRGPGTNRSSLDSRPRWGRRQALRGNDTGRCHRGRVAHPRRNAPKTCTDIAGASAGKALAFGGDFAYRYARSIWNGTTT